MAVFTAGSILLPGFKKTCVYGKGVKGNEKGKEWRENIKSIVVHPSNIFFVNKLFDPMSSSTHFVGLTKA